jgi:hypothetical protein
MHFDDNASLSHSGYAPQLLTGLQSGPATSAKSLA